MHFVETQFCVTNNSLNEGRSTEATFTLFFFYMSKNE